MRSSISKWTSPWHFTAPTHHTYQKPQEKTYNRVRDSNPGTGPSETYFYSCQQCLGQQGQWINHLNLSTWVVEFFRWVKSNLRCFRSSQKYFTNLKVGLEQLYFLTENFRLCGCAFRKKTFMVNWHGNGWSRAFRSNRHFSCKVRRRHQQRLASSRKVWSRAHRERFKAPASEALGLEMWLYKDYMVRK